MVHICVYVWWVGNESKSLSARDSGYRSRSAITFSGGVQSISSKLIIAGGENIAVSAWFGYLIN